MSERIAGPSLVGSLDIKGIIAGFDDMIKWSGRTKTEVENNLSQIGSRFESALNEKIGGIEGRWTTLLDRLETRMSKGVFTPAIERDLKGLETLFRNVGNLDQALRAKTLLNIGEQFGIPKAITDVQQLNSALQQTGSVVSNLGQSLQQVVSSKLNELTRDMTSYNNWLQTRAGSAVAPVSQAGLWTSAVGGSGQNANPWISSLQQAAANPMPTRNRTTPEDYLAAARLIRRLEADENRARSVNLPILNRDYQPSVQFMDNEDEILNRIRTREAWERNQNPYTQAAVTRSPAAIMAARQEHTDRVQTMLQQMTGSPVINAATVAGLRDRIHWHSEQDIRQQQLQQNAAGVRGMIAGFGRVDPYTPPTPPDQATLRQRERFGYYLRDRAEQHAAADELRMEQSRRLQQAIMPEWEQMGFRRGVIGGNALAGFGEADLSPEELRNRRRINPATGRPLSLGAENRFRFAAQNVGFGIDDAIQSYQYGGIGASIRAASNNATAIAGLMISNPMVAAATVVGVSALSAALPTILKRSGSIEDSTLTKAADAYYTVRTGRLSGAIRRGELLSPLMDISGQEDARISQIQNRDTAIATIQKFGGVVFKDAAGNYTTNTTNVRRFDQGGNVNSPEEMASVNAAVKFLSTSGEKEAELKANFDAVVSQSRMAVAAFDIKALRSKNASAVGYKTRLGLVTSEEDYRQTLIDQSRTELDQIAKSGRSAGGKEVASNAVRMRLWEQLADDDTIRQAVLANNLEQRQFEFQTEGSGSRLEQINLNFLNQRDILKAQRDSLPLEDKANRNLLDNRAFALSLKTKRDKERAVEDEVERLNPERNPLTRILKRFTRDSEDLEKTFNLANLDPDQEKAILLAQLRGVERSRFEASTPSGTRRFITDGYQVGSREDEELRSRMLGNFAQRDEERKFQDSMNLEEIKEELKRLTEQLKFEAAELNR